ncbi:MAG: TetR/AcrR family transcriptional regulator [Candidatus Promineifilaceae bacterium]|nr:TetR/AcrR family transcriptional regulator [Candidatus Promineifilaceae bacterium]
MPKQIADEDIFHVTMRLFVERGYAGATTRQIAEEAEINEVTLFRKFSSKAELVAAAVAHEVGRIAEEDFPYTGDVEADLLQIVSGYRGAVSRYGEFLPVLLAEIPRHPELRPVLQAPFRVLTAIGRVLERYQEAGILRPEPPLQAVSGLLGPVMVLTMMGGADPDLALPSPEPEAIVAAFLHGRLETGSERREDRRIP